MTPEEIIAARAQFANETGYTVEEWLARWDAGQIDQVAEAERHALARDLASRPG
jgi:hypothetical protein